MWTVRESVLAGLVACGYVFTYDVSLALGKVPECMAALRQRVSAVDQARVSVVGHLGDGKALPDNLQRGTLHWFVRAVPEIWPLS